MRVRPAPGQTDGNSYSAFVKFEAAECTQPSELPRLGKVLSERRHLFLPLVVIIGVLLSGRRAPFAALCGIASTIPSALLRRSTRQ